MDTRTLGGALLVSALVTGWLSSTALTLAADLCVWTGVDTAVAMSVVLVGALVGAWYTLTAMLALVLRGARRLGVGALALERALLRAGAPVLRQAVVAGAYAGLGLTLSVAPGAAASPAPDGSAVVDVLPADLVPGAPVHPPADGASATAGRDAREVSTDGPTVVPTDGLAEVPTDVPADVLTDAPVDMPSDVPVEVPADLGVPGGSTLAPPPGDASAPAATVAPARGPIPAPVGATAGATRATTTDGRAPASSALGASAASPDPARAGAASTPTAPVTYAVRAGDSLWSIAAAGLGPGAGDADIARAWPRWYEANADTIGPDPDLIHPGQLLLAPTEETDP